MTEPTTSASGAGQRLGEREVLVLDPCVVQVYERIVHHVQRVRYVAQEFAYPRRHLVRRLARSPETDEQREERRWRKRRRTARSSTSARCRRCAARPSSATTPRAPIQNAPLTRHGLEYARQQQPGREREQQAQGAAELCSLPSGRTRRRCRRAVPRRRTPPARSRRARPARQAPGSEVCG